MKTEVHDLDKVLQATREDTAKRIFKDIEFVYVIKKPALKTFYIKIIEPEWQELKKKYGVV